MESPEKHEAIAIVGMGKINLPDLIEIAEKRAEVCLVQDVDGLAESAMRPSYGSFSKTALMDGKNLTIPVSRHVVSIMQTLSGRGLLECEVRICSRKMRGYLTTASSG